MKNTVIENRNSDLASPVETGISLFDSGQFQQMWVIADAMSKSSLVPQTLRGDTNEETQANCLRVVEQAGRWGFSPFAVLDHASLVHGKLMWEGKIVSAAITALTGIRLKYVYSGSGENRKVVVSGRFADENEDRTVEGTVSDWKTTGNGSPWSRASNHDQMLAYRGARQWGRRYASEIMLGVSTLDEYDESSLKEANGRVVDKAEPLAAPATDTEEVKNAKPEPVAEVVEKYPDLEKYEMKLEGISTDPTDPKKCFVTLSAGEKIVNAYTLDSNLAIDAEFLTGEKVKVQMKYDEENKVVLLSVQAVEPSLEGGIA